MGKKDEHLSLGKGNINWKLVMERLSDYKGIFVTEMGSVEEGIQSLEYLRKL
jgi:sugar phosphate isomerase/epimerase